MAETIEQAEAIPEGYPQAPAGLSTAAAALDPSMIWQRIEAYVAHRWSARDVVWIIEGPGGWKPPLTPATIASVEIWNGETWETVMLSPSPLGGYCLPGCGPYRFTGTAGGGDVPAAVSEAFRRLAEYMASKPGKAGATTEGITAGSISLTHRRSASWLAEAIQNSGAGDLLRTYRRV
ncbi:hypothetical protein [Aurantimonas sp. 22II-16-19i]|uniref:hypothetical protein n=1 Tax=Aurantimonas sp. 22II-16-19i TaxID=1317114 RepID=UPI0009F80237|nr:hypothetical protein [Aurantimonas sp. 22II-16-19i]ORE94848.1 hypothetical protein ATO4_13240 [Aurantimonas sp. 22II-16-19i]